MPVAIETLVAIGPKVFSLPEVTRNAYKIAYRRREGTQISALAIDSGCT